MAIMHLPTTRVSLLPQPLPIVVFAFLVSGNKFAHLYETYDPTDQIAEESSVAKSYIDPYDSPDASKEVNITLDHNDLERDWPTTTAPTNGTSPTSTGTSTADPLDAILPLITFTCKNKSESYYSDPDFCDIFHYCKSNGYRFTFLCPNDSFYNSLLMACEQNATHLALCKEKTATGKTLTGWALTAKLNLNTNGKSGITKKPEQDLLAQDSMLSTAFESTRVGASPPASGQTEPSLLATVRDHLSTTTFIPPALFIEPTASNMIMDEFPAQFDEIVAMTLASTLASNVLEPTPTTTTTTTEASSTIDSTSFSSTKKPQNELVIQPEHKEQSIHIEPVTLKEADNSTRHINLVFPSRHITQSEFFKSQNKKSPLPNLQQILKDLDMSNFEISTDGQFPILPSSAKKFNFQPHLNGMGGFYENAQHHSEPPTKFNSDFSKLSLSIHKFFRESMPTNYLKNVPKILRSLNAMRDYEASIHDSTSPTMPRKNDLSAGSGADEGEPTTSGSMLSIPVLVPVSLSPEDYRRRMSASVLKPIVIPLKEKGKLIPAYVLQFSSRHNRRHKRSALNGKRLLSLSLKPNLLYQVFPSLLKIKPSASSSKQTSAAMASGKANLHMSMLMAAQGAMPHYRLPNGQLLPANQLVNLLKFASPYDLNDFKYFVPPYYFMGGDRHPYLHYRPVDPKKIAAFKRPPLRAKIPIGPVTNATTTNGNFSSSTPLPTGLMAVGSAPAGQAVSTPVPSTLLYGGLARPITGTRATTFPPNFMPAMYGNRYYSPLLYFGNTFVGRDPSKFKPMMKKSTLLRKLKSSKNVFNANEERPSEAAPNITMPANIYVPDDILEDVQAEAPEHKSNTTAKMDNSNIDHKVSNDLLDSFSSDESRAVEVFARRHNQSSLFVPRNSRAMRDRGRSSHRELSSQAKVNANFFNGTAVKVTAKLTVPETSKAAKGESHKVPRDANISGNAYRRHEVSKVPASGEAYSEDSGLYEREPGDSHRLNMTSYLRHLKTNSAADSAQ